MALPASSSGDEVEGNPSVGCEGLGDQIFGSCQDSSASRVFKHASMIKIASQGPECCSNVRGDRMTTLSARQPTLGGTSSRYSTMNVAAPLVAARILRECKNVESSGVFRLLYPKRLSNIAIGGLIRSLPLQEAISPWLERVFSIRNDSYILSSLDPRVWLSFGSVRGAGTDVKEKRTYVHSSVAERRVKQ